MPLPLQKKDLGETPFPPSTPWPPVWRHIPRPVPGMGGMEGQPWRGYHKRDFQGPWSLTSYSAFFTCALGQPEGRL